MKIDGILTGTPLAPDLKRNDKDPNECNFQSLLEGAHAQLNKSCLEISQSSLDKTDEILANSLSTVSSLNCLTDVNDITQTHALGLQACEDILGILERYQSAMANADIPFKKEGLCLFFMIHNEDELLYHNPSHSLRVIDL